MEYCVCRHERELHWALRSTSCAATIGIGSTILPDVETRIGCECKKFKLDNLKLIEDIAKERKLI